MPTRSRMAVALALASIGGVTAPAADAAWTAPQTLVADTAAIQVTSAGNRHGSEAFAWTVGSTRIVHTAGQTGQASWVRARIRLPDGRLGRVQTISSTSGIVTGPQIGVDALGNATAVWTQAGRHLSIMAAYRPHGTRFGAPVEIGRSGHFNDARPALAVGPFGDAVVAWNAGAGVEVVRRGPPVCTPQRARACFSSPLRLRAGADQTVAIGPLGSAYVVWAAQARSGADAVDTRIRMIVLRRSGRRAGSEHFLSTSGDASQPSLAVQRDGVAVVVWRASLPTGGEQNQPAPIVAASSSPGAVSAAPGAISELAGELPQVRVNAQGEAIAVWSQLRPTPANPDGPEIASAVRLAGATAFAAPVSISAPRVFPSRPSLAVDAAGTAYLVYGTGAGTGSVSHVRPAAGTFGAPLALAPGFGGGSVLTAGAKATAVGRTPRGRTRVSDWTS